MTIKEGPHRTLHHSLGPIGVEFTDVAFNKQIELLDRMVVRILKERGNKTDAQLEISLTGVELLKAQLLVLKERVSQEIIRLYPQMSYDVPLVSASPRGEADETLAASAPLVVSHNAPIRTVD